MINSEAPGRQNQLFFAGIWVVITVFLVLATQLVGISGAEGNSTDVQASDFPLEGVDVAAHPLPSVVYGGIMWSLEDVRISDAEGLLGRASLEVDLQATNTLAHLPLRASSGLISVTEYLPQTDDEASPRSEGRILEIGRRLTLQPDQTERVTVQFEVPFSKTPNKDHLALVFSEPNRIEAILPLDGTIVPTGYPIAAAVDTTPITIPDPDDSSRRIVIEADAASVDVNAGPHRASIDHQLLTIKLTVQRTETLDAPGFAMLEFWTLEHDGEVRSPLVVAKTAQPATNADEITLLFAFPDEAEGLHLVAKGGENTPLAIALPRG